MANVYVKKISDFNNQKVDLSSINPVRKTYLEKLSLNAQKISFYAWLLLKEKALEEFDLDIDSLQLFYNEYGKPMFKEFYFNISHSKNLIAVGLSKNLIGIDIQVIEGKDVSKLSKKMEIEENDIPAFYKVFSQWLRDYRKKGYKIDYLLVPELHKDNAWHLHGFFSGLPELVSFSSMRKCGDKVPDYLVFSDFYNWQQYQDKFGFCSFGRIKSPIRSAFYISKYITKDHDRMVTDLGAKMFYSSQGLNKAIPHGEIYGHSDFLDSFLQQEYQFCSVGMTKVSNQQNWTFAFEDQGFEFLDKMTPLFDDHECASTSFCDDLAEINIEVEQMSFMLDSQ